MRRTKLLIVFGVILGAGTAMPTLAQDSTTATPKPGGALQMTPDQVTNTLAAKLNLTDDQKEQIQPIIADRQQQIRALRDDTSSRRMKKMRKMKSIFHESDKKIEGILTDQQKRQYIQIEQQLREQMKDRGAMNGSSQ